MPLPARLTRTAHSLRRAVLRRRRLLAAAGAAVAVFVGLSAVSPPPPDTVPVVVARRDLAAGVRLGPDDITTARFAPATAPAGLADDVVGAMLAGPLTRGEPVTDVRLVGPSLSEGLDDRVAVPVRLPDAGMVGLLEVGDHVDLVAVDPQSGDDETVAIDVPVLAVPGPSTDPEGGSSLPGRLVVVGVTPGEVAPLADAAVRRFVTYSWSSD